MKSNEEEKNRILRLHESHKGSYGSSINEQTGRNKLQQDVSLLADHLDGITGWVSENDMKEIDVVIRKYIDSNRICVLWDAYKLLDTDGLLDQIDEIGEMTASDTTIELKNSLIIALEDANCAGTNLTEYIPFTPDITIPSTTRIKDKFVRKGSQLWDKYIKESITEQEASSRTGGGGATSTSSSGQYISSSAWTQGGILTKDGRQEDIGDLPVEVDITGGDYEDVDDVTHDTKRGQIEKPMERENVPCCKKCKNGKFKKCGTKAKDCKYATISDCQLRGEQGNITPLKVKNINEYITRMKKLLK